MANLFHYRDGYRGKVPADVAATELEKIRQAGDLTSERTVAAAQPKDAPLHPQFTWNDKTAGHQFRLIEARQLIRSVVVVHQDEKGDQVAPESRYVHVPAKEGPSGRYVPLATIIESQDDYTQALRQYQRAWEAAESAFHELRRKSEGRNDNAEALAIASQGFATVKQALELLRIR